MQCCTEKITTVESQFFKPPRETKIALKNWIVREISGKITAFDCGGETTFGLSFLEVEKMRV